MSKKKLKKKNERLKNEIRVMQLAIQEQRRELDIVSNEPASYKAMIIKKRYQLKRQFQNVFFK